MRQLGDNLPIFGQVDGLLHTLMTDYFAGSPAGVNVVSLLSDKIKPPYLYARAERRSGSISLRTKDERFTKTAIITVNTIADGVDADEDAGLMQEAARQALMKAWLNQVVIPNEGHIQSLETSTPACRVSDYASSTGVVQYASLPQGWVRYEAVYRLVLRPPKVARENQFINPDL